MIPVRRLAAGRLRGDVLVVDCRDAWRCGAILPRCCGWRSTRRAASMPSRRSLPRSWHALTSNTHGSSPATTAASTGTTHQSKSIELVQSQYRAPQFMQFRGDFSVHGGSAWARYGLDGRRASNPHERLRRAALAPGQRIYGSYTLVELSKGAATERWPAAGRGAA